MRRVDQDADQYALRECIALRSKPMKLWVTCTSFKFNVELNELVFAYTHFEPHLITGAGSRASFGNSEEKACTDSCQAS